MEQERLQPSPIPAFFYPLLWSYDTKRLDSERDKKTIIVQALNYGDLIHWRWLIDHYGRREMRNFLTTLAETELRPRVRRLVQLLFDIDHFNHALRSAQR